MIRWAWHRILGHNRPQNCDCGASQPALVAHWERCAFRTP